MGKTLSDNKKSLRGIYLISEGQLPQDWDAYGALLGEILEEGVGIFQLRIKPLPGESISSSQILDFSRRLRLITAEKNCLYIVNDDDELACKSEADGLHLGPQDLEVKSFHDIRKKLSSSMMIGLSHHNLEDVYRQCLWPADYVSVGPLYATTSKMKAEPVLGYPLFEKCLPYFKSPLCAIGGITLDRLPRVLQTGVEMVGVISDIWRNPDPKEQIRQWNKIWKESLVKKEG